MSDKERMLEKIELYCDSGRRAMVPQDELEANAPTLEECMEAYNAKNV